MFSNTHTLIIAELSANHLQKYDHALELVRAAKRAGADAIKLQTYTADTITLDCDNDYFRVKHGTIWDGRTLHQLYTEAYTPWEWHESLMKEAERLGMIFFSTPFDKTSVDFLEKLGVKLYKIASFELIDIPLIETIAKTGKPIIMSTGMGTLAEIDSAVRAIRAVNSADLCLLKCTSAYPSSPEEMNLKTIPHLAEAFGVSAGLSDHTLGSEVAIAAVALGARVIEKHLTLNRTDGGPDGAFSMEPDEFRAMVSAIRVVESAIGKVSYEPTLSERAGLAFRRSLFVVKDISAGELFSVENIRSIRPAGGLKPALLPVVLGRRASRNLKQGMPLTESDIS